MTGLEFIDGLVRSLVWPICIAIAIIIFRVQLRSIASKVEDRVPFLQSVKVGSAEMSFSEQVQETIHQSEDLAATAMALSGDGQADATVEVGTATVRIEAHAPSVRGTGNDDLDVIRSFARFNPNAALIATGAYAESLLRSDFQRKYPSRRDDAWILNLDDVAAALRDSGRDAEAVETTMGLVRLGLRTQTENPTTANSITALELTNSFAFVARYFAAPKAP